MSMSDAPELSKAGGVEAWMQELAAHDADAIAGANWKTNERARWIKDRVVVISEFAKHAPSQTSPSAAASPTPQLQARLESAAQEVFREFGGFSSKAMSIEAIVQILAWHIAPLPAPVPHLPRIDSTSITLNQAMVDAEDGEPDKCPNCHGYHRGGCHKNTPIGAHPAKAASPAPGKCPHCLCPQVITGTHPANAESLRERFEEHTGEQFKGFMQPFMRRRKDEEYFYSDVRQAWQLCQWAYQAGAATQPVVSAESLRDRFEKWWAEETWMGMPRVSSEKDYAWRAVQHFSQAGAASPQPGWISVKERLPELGEWVIVVIGGNVQRTMCRLQQCYPYASRWEWQDSDADVAPLEAVTHWQPLPTPPSHKVEAAKREVK
jgi:Protein of unknown function (DUF551)